MGVDPPPGVKAVAAIISKSKGWSRFWFNGELSPDPTLFRPLIIGLPMRGVKFIGFGRQDLR